MLTVTEIMLLRFYTDFKEILSILTFMNIHIVDLPVL